MKEKWQKYLGNKTEENYDKEQKKEVKNVVLNLKKFYGKSLKI